MKRRQKETVDSLLLLGNGFDLAHGLKSGWTNFQEFWLDGIKTPSSPLVSHLQGCPKCRKFGTPCSEGWGLVTPDEDELTSRLYTEGLTDEAVFIQLCKIALEVSHRDGSRKLLWSDFEDNLSRMVLPDFDDWDWDQTDDYEWEYVSVLDSTGTDIRGVIDRRFKSWFNSLDLVAKPQPQLRAILDRYSRIINFNYTPTLANAYGIKDPIRLTHIHGTLAGGDLAYGHAREIQPEKWPTSTNALIGMETSAHLHQLRKQLNTDIIWRRLKPAKSGRLHDVASYGFSFGRADRGYLELLAKDFCSKDTIWTQYYYSEKDVDSARDMLAGVRFPGRINPVATQSIAS